MAQGRKKNNFVPRTRVSPLWKDSTSSNAFTPRMHMRPPQTSLTSLDTFMAAHSPRRFCQARQKYILSEYIVFIWFNCSLCLLKVLRIARKCHENEPLNLVYEREDYYDIFVFFYLHAEPLTLDKRITDTGYVRVQQKTRNDSR